MTEQRWRIDPNHRGPYVALTIHTRRPDKWLMIDRETGHQWEWRDGSWRTPLDGRSEEQHPRGR